MTKNFKRFLMNGLMLTFVSLLMRGVGVSFNAYISNKIGAQAMGLFTLISTVYGFAITLATSGINLATTRLVSESLGTVGENGIERSFTRTTLVRTVMTKCVSYSLFFGLLSGGLLFLGADIIGTHILRDTRTITSLKILAFTLPPISLSSSLNGYFTAVRHVYKNALTQMLEQLIRIMLCIVMLTRLFADDVESACLCIIIGGAVAELFSFLMQTILYFAEKRTDTTKDATQGKLIQHKLLGIALPVAFSAYLRSALVTIEHILIPYGLEKSGASREISLAAYGTLHSMVFPIVFFPSAILSSFSSLLVPEVARENSDPKSKKVQNMISVVFETALLFSIGTAGIMIFFSYEIGNAIYPSTDAGMYIKMIAPLIPIMYLDTAVDALLKGLGEQVYSMGVNIVDSLLSVILVIFLLPKYGIMGYIITVYFTEIINATLSVTRLLRISKVSLNAVSLVLKPLLCVIASAFAIKFISEYLPNTLPSGSLGLVFNVTLSTALYISLLCLTKTIKFTKKSKKALEISNLM